MVAYKTRIIAKYCQGRYINFLIVVKSSIAVLKAQVKYLHVLKEISTIISLIKIRYWPKQHFIYLPTTNGWRIVGPVLPRSSVPWTKNSCLPSGTLYLCQAPVFPDPQNSQFDWSSKAQRNLSAVSSDVQLNHGLPRLCLGRFGANERTGPEVSKTNSRKHVKIISRRST